MCLIIKPLLNLILRKPVFLKLPMFVTIVVFLVTLVLIVSSCILISECQKKHMVSSQGAKPLFGELIKALSFLTQFKGNTISSMSSSGHARTYAFSSSQPKTQVVWVRKDSKT